MNEETVDALERRVATLEIVVDKLTSVLGTLGALLAELPPILGPSD